MNSEALAAALDPAVRDYGWLKVLEDAARERLAQLPKKCEHCNGTGSTFDDPACYACTCPICHGSGKVYPAELVERIADAIHEQYDTNGGYHAQAVAALDALDGETP